MPKRRELRLQKKIRDRIIELGGQAIIVPSGEVVGQADLFGCIKGLTLYLEVKDGDEYEVQPIQKYRLEKWRKAGAWTTSVKSFAEAEHVLLKVFIAGRPPRL